LTIFEAKHGAMRKLQGLRGFYEAFGVGTAVRRETSVGEYSVAAAVVVVVDRGLEWMVG
jgi:glutamyl-tRNA reductase